MTETKAIRERDTVHSERQTLGTPRDNERNLDVVERIAAEHDEESTPEMKQTEQLGKRK